MQQGCDIFVVAGGAYVDELHEVAQFPKEDSTTRALSVRRQRGGNASTTAVVLRQLLDGPRKTVHWMGAVPAAASDMRTLVLNQMRAAGVETRLRDEVSEPTPGDVTIDIPSAIIMLSKATGSRTVVSNRRGLRELSPDHFASQLPNLGHQSADSSGWVHLECREYASAVKMTREVGARRRAGEPWTMSIEIEKPVLGVGQVVELCMAAQVVFFSQEWLEEHSRSPILNASLHGSPPQPSGRQGPPPQVLRYLRALLQATKTSLPAASASTPCAAQDSKVVWIATWGASGAVALESDATTRTELLAHLEPAFAVQNVVESVGAGDTFIAACVAALARGALVGQALREGCHLAACKVSQSGFDGLGKRLEDFHRQTRGSPDNSTTGSRKRPHS